MSNSSEVFAKKELVEKSAGLSSASVHIPSIGREMQIMGYTYKVSGIEVTETTATIKLNKPSNLMFR